MFQKEILKVTLMNINAQMNNLKPKTIHYRVKIKDVVQKLLMVWAQTDNPNPPLWFIGLEGLHSKIDSFVGSKCAQ